MKKHYRLDFLTDYYGDDNSSMREILRLYLDETPRDIIHIEECLENRDTSGAKAATHKIKTNVAMLGIQDPAAFIEAMHGLSAEDEINDDIKGKFLAFKTEVARGLDDIKNDFFNLK